MEQEEQNQNFKPETEGETVRKSGLAYAAAFTLFSTVAVLLGAGYLLDRWLDSSPWGIVGGIVLGSIVGFYQFVRITSRIYK
ncbi:MAG: AtpZ/AtpI family protein [Acidobacteriota bacterium]|nr:AtpZ/AtpI family protein [Acidobacteriota bacterium]